MKRSITRHWRFAAIVMSLCATGLIFRSIHGGTIANLGGLIGAVPVAVAAVLIGGRAAFVTVILEGVLNLSLLGATPQSVEVIAADVVEGAALSLLAIAFGAVQSARHRVTLALSTDAVTGLGNREAFLNRIGLLIRRGNAFMTVAVLQLVDFGDVNEAFGIDIGDKVLRTIGEKVALLAGPQGFVAKDVRSRFMIVWPKQERPDEEIARDLIAALSDGLVIGGGSLQLRGHVGIGRWNVTGGSRAEDLLRGAKRAVARAEREGLEWCGAERLSAPESATRLQTMSDLGHAITNGELRLHYQPLVELPDRGLRGFEALVRWQHPTRGLLAPGEFIGLAEQTGLVVPLTQWVIGEAVRQSRVWDAAGLHARISVNVGAKVLASGAGLPEMIERLTRANGVAPSALVIEVTETDVMSDPTRSIAILRSLKALGCRIEVDDFGTGYSSLSYLRQFPLDGVKIDRSFTKAMLTDTSTAAIVRASIELSHALGLEVVAEGIEDYETMARLTVTGCDAVQGYFIARPMPADLVVEWVADHIATAPHADNEPMPVLQDGTRGTVLVVDDEHKLRLAAHRILSASGYRVIDAATASEALQLYKTHADEIGLVLTDVHLSDWKGPDLAKHLRGSTPNLPVVFMSGDAKAADVGNAPFLAKPFSKMQLIAEIERAIA
jgi:EAL domain-containing protein (putative c-di-GMP-specific phosphodiesterase class I)/PleD family two-component response regulator